MGEMANDIIEGRCCDICCSYFEKNGATYTHGYAATCLDCWKDLTEEQKVVHNKAKVKTQ